MTHTPAVLVVTAVRAEAEAVAGGLGGAEPTRLGPFPLWRCASADVLAGGVGMAAAAAAAAYALARSAYRLVVCAGIAGGFMPPTSIGDLVVADAVHAADLGIVTDAGLVPLDVAGAEPGLPEPNPIATPLRAALLVGGLAPTVGGVVTVCGVTGSEDRSEELRRRYPRAVAEAMEGYGVGVAAVQADVPFAEVRAVSNRVGRRERERWDIPTALASLGKGFAALAGFFDTSASFFDTNGSGNRTEYA